ncbi:hypothetical protein C3B44_09790 [Corynebacterium yudongzhengii]|uniref:Bacterial SCP orthologue domain-containing protein n=1 Tax=Corynebacterium yudongzhengii TaxID=2080740 RepID=A0A2U1T5Q0_9CORY|nr:sterol carrier family protein [Corynebacterium yudongzhengii]AWB82592.1 hypothetical protein C3B44_09790 [Corynebacterium yudongzhengii]PWC01326.1 hypothetical protein DF222_07940 [Corynebacterium yudongzhengii]
MAKKIDPETLRASVAKISDWLDRGAPDADRPARQPLAAAVRATARTLAQDAPGHSVEVRIPPFVAVQCIEGPVHTRGTPPNVVETDARTWLLLATGRLSWEEVLDARRADVSGSRAAEIARWLPIIEC